MHPKLWFMKKINIQKMIQSDSKSPTLSQKSWRAVQNKNEFDE